MPTFGDYRKVYRESFMSAQILLNSLNGLEEEFKYDFFCAFVLAMS